MTTCSGPKVTTPCGFPAPPQTHTLTRTRSPRVPNLTTTLPPPPRLRRGDAAGARMLAQAMAAARSAQRRAGPRLCPPAQLHPAGPGRRGPAEPQRRRLRRPGRPRPRSPPLPAASPTPRAPGRTHHFQSPVSGSSPAARASGGWNTGAGETTCGLSPQKTQSPKMAGREVASPLLCLPSPNI